LRRRRFDSGKLLVAFPAALFIAFILAPVSALFVRSSPGAFLAALQQADVQEALRLSALTTAITLVCAVAFGTPIAYLLARWSFPGRTLLDTLSICRSSYRRRSPASHC
jgi:molybdate transport system permease protein